MMNLNLRGRFVFLLINKKIYNNILICDNDGEVNNSYFIIVLLLVIDDTTYNNNNIYNLLHIHIHNIII